MPSSSSGLYGACVVWRPMGTGNLPLLISPYVKAISRSRCSCNGAGTKWPVAWHLCWAIGCVSVSVGLLPLGRSRSAPAGR